MSRATVSGMTILFFACMLPIAGLVHAQPFTPADYFPLVVGNHWRDYSVSDTSRPEDNRWRFTDIVQDTILGIPGESQTFRMQWSENIFGNSDTTVFWDGYVTYDTNGNLCMSAFWWTPDSLVVYDTCRLWIPNPIQVSDTIRSDQGGMHWTRVIVSITDTLNIPLGDFSNCLGIWDSMSFENGAHIEVSYSKYIPPTWIGQSYIAGEGRGGGTTWVTDPPYTQVGYSYLDGCQIQPMSAADDILISMVRTFHLHQNYPNPFNAATNIGFTLLRPERASLQVFDITGRLAATVVDEHLLAGTYTLRFDGRGLSSGMYVYRLQTGSETDCRRMILLK